MADVAPPLPAFAGAADAAWPTFGWVEDMRPALARAAAAGRTVALATLYLREGSAPRSPGAQMLFDGGAASGYFSGGCIEADVALHAAEVIADGVPQRLHYGAGSPWIDIRLRCGGALHIFVERVEAGGPAVLELLAAAAERRSVLWESDGRGARVTPAGAAPLLKAALEPLRIARRYDPPARVIVSGWDPTALALARLAVDAQIETWVVRPDGPREGPPIPGIHYLRCPPAEALAAIGVDAWTAFVGATHDSDLDLPACAAALKGGAGYVGLVGAASRVPERREMILAAGAPEATLDRLHAPAGMPDLGKAPWRIAIGIIAELLRTMVGETSQA